MTWLFEIFNLVFFFLKFLFLFDNSNALFAGKSSSTFYGLQPRASIFLCSPHHTKKCCVNKYLTGLACSQYAVWKVQFVWRVLYSQTL